MVSHKEEKLDVKLGESNTGKQPCRIQSNRSQTERGYLIKANQSSIKGITKQLDHTRWLERVKGQPRGGGGGVAPPPSHSVPG